MTIDGICGRLRFIAATEKEARLSKIQGSPYTAGEAENETIAIGMETRQTTRR
jgi:hypothetical protein